MNEKKCVAGWETYATEAAVSLASGSSGEPRAGWETYATGWRLERADFASMKLAYVDE